MCETRIAFDVYVECEAFELFIFAKESTRWVERYAKIYITNRPHILQRDERAGVVPLEHFEFLHVSYACATSKYVVYSSNIILSAQQVMRGLRRMYGSRGYRTF